MLQPKRVKYRRPHIIKYEGLSKGGNEVAFGEYGLQAIEGAWVSDRQIEACRVVLSRYTSRAGKSWIRIFPHLAKTKKPAEVRMGSGKGNPEYWVAVVKTNRILFEIAGIPEDQEKEALKMCMYKLPLKCRIVKTTRSVAHYIHVDTVVAAPTPAATTATVAEPTQPEVIHGGNEVNEGASADKSQKKESTR
jgi:large subunit ribosomal protein L16